MGQFLRGKMASGEKQCKYSEGGRGPEDLTEKNEKKQKMFREENRPDRAEQNTKLEGNCLRGQNSLQTKRAKNIRK